MQSILGLVCGYHQQTTIPRCLGEGSDLFLAHHSPEIAALWALGRILVESPLTQSRAGQVLGFHNYFSCFWKLSKRKLKFAWLKRAKATSSFRLPLVLRFWPSNFLTIFSTCKNMFFMFYLAFSTVGLNNLACYVHGKGNECYQFFSIL